MKQRFGKGVGTDEMALIDLVVTMSNEMVVATKAAYQKKFLIPMQFRVVGRLFGVFGFSC